MCDGAEVESGALQLGAHVGPMVCVAGVVEAILQDDQVDAKHQCFVLHDVDVLRIAGGDPALVKPRVFCAVRYGEDVGKERIGDLEIGCAVEVQGEYLSKGFPTFSNRDGLPVIHCAHKPFGYVKIGEQHYQ